jgi:hypothetical protein
MKRSSSFCFRVSIVTSGERFDSRSKQSMNKLAVLAVFHKRRFSADFGR